MLAKHKDCLGIFLCVKMLACIYWICIVLQTVTKCQMNMHSITKCWDMSIQYTQCYKILSNVNSICTLLQNVIKCQFNIHSVTKCYQMSIQSAQCFNMLANVICICTYLGSQILTGSWFVCIICWIVASKSSMLSLCSVFLLC